MKKTIFYIFFIPAFLLNEVYADTNTWVQTARSDFESGTLGVVDASSTPGSLQFDKKISLYNFDQNLSDAVSGNSAIFSRNSSSSMLNGTEVSINVPRYENGKFGKGIYIGDGTTNLLTNTQSTAEEITVGFIAQGNTTLSRSTSEKWQGNYSLKMTIPTQVAIRGLYTTGTTGTFLSGTSYTGSVYLKGSGSINLYLWGSGANGAGTGVVANLTTEWKRYEVNRSLSVNASEIRLYISTASNASSTVVYADGFQIEQGTYATPWHQGAIPLDDSITNLLSANQNSIETNTVGFTSNNSATLSTSSNESYIGGQSLKVVTPGSVTSEGFFTNSITGTFNTGETYVSSLRVKGTGTVMMRTWSNAGSNTSSTFNLEPDSWQYVRLPHTLTATSTQLRIYFYTAITAQATTFYVDDLKIYREPGYNNNTRQKDVLKIPNTLDKKQGSISMWIRGDLNKKQGFYWLDEGHFSIFRANSSHLIEFSEGTDSVYDQDLGAASVFFDDAKADVFYNAYPIMKAYGIKGTTAVITDWVGNPDYMTLAQLHELQDNGWSIIAHTKTHPHLTSLGNEDVSDQCLGSQQWLVQNGFTGYKHFVVPYHDADMRVVNICAQYFDTIRWISSSSGNDIPPKDNKMLNAWLSDSADHNEVKTLWDTVMQNDKWGYVYLHGVADDQKGNFEDMISYLANTYPGHSKNYEEFFGEYLSRRGAATLNHVVTTWGGEGLKLYVNGILVKQGNFSEPTALNDWIYLLSDQNESNQANAIIDDLSIFGRELSASEVASIYNSGSSSGIYNATSTTFISSAYDTGKNSTFGNVSWTAALPAGTSVKFQIRTASSLDELNNATWYGPDDRSGYYLTSGTNINTIHDHDRWIQYKALLTSDDQNETPILEEVKITYDTETGNPHSKSLSFDNGVVRSLLSVSKPVSQVKVVDKKTMKTLTDSAEFTSNLYYSTTSYDVKRMQSLLATEMDVYPEGLVTGYFGPLTRKAIQRFQIKYGVLTSKYKMGYGVFGPKTRAMMKMVYGNGSL